MRFELYKDYESTRRILQTCGMRIPWFRSIDVDEVRIDRVATLDWDPLFRAAKLLESKRLEYLDSRPFEPDFSLNPGDYYFNF